MLRVGRPITPLALWRVVCEQQQRAINFVIPLISFRQSRNVRFNNGGPSPVAMDIDQEAERESKKAARQARLLSKSPNSKEHRGSIATPKRGILPLDCNRSGGRRDGLLYIP